MTKEKKSMQMKLIEQKFSSPFVILISFSGISMKHQTQIRKTFRQLNAEFKVIKNTLAKKICQEKNLTSLIPYFKKTTALIVSNDNFQNVTKTLLELMKDYPNLEIKIGLLQNKLISTEQIKNLSLLPPKEVLLSQVLSAMQIPISSLVQVLIAPIKDLISVINKIEEIKIKGG